MDNQPPLVEVRDRARTGHPARDAVDRAVAAGRGGHNKASRAASNASRPRHAEVAIRRARPPCLHPRSWRRCYVYRRTA
jgi:hypothetical protein